MNEAINRFNVRVYFVCYDEERKCILLSDEIIKGNKWTKFPGGGLKFGEGTLDCAKREALEELGQEIEITGHLYTTDFFVQSAFHVSHQIISIYYEAKLKSMPRFRTTSQRFHFTEATEGAESFRWVEITKLDANEMELPADKVVALMLIQNSK